MGGDAQGGGESTRRIAPFFRDLGVTVLAQAAVALGGLWLARLLAIRTGTDGFASYSLVKQAVNVFFPIVTVGLVGGLPRYLALPARGRDPAPEGYLAAAALICGAATAVVAGTGPRASRPHGARLLRVPRRDAPGGPLRRPSRGHIGLLRGLRLVPRARADARRRPDPGGGLRPGAPGGGARAAGPAGGRDHRLDGGPARGACRWPRWPPPLLRALRDRRRARTGDAAGTLFTYGHRRVPGRAGPARALRLRPPAGCSRGLGHGRGLPERRTAGAERALASPCCPWAS